jgi:hypothetical protein
MQRRNVLQGGAAAAGIGALGGCASPRPPLEPGVMPPDMHGFLTEVDERMEAMNGAAFVRGFASSAAKRSLTESEEKRLEPHEHLFRGMLRTLYLTQTFRDLPEEAQMHPGMQRRMLAHVGEVDRTVTNVTELLEGLDDEKRAKLQDHLRKQPALAMTIAEAIDEHAGAAGVSSKRRLQLRSMMMQASFRLKHSAPGAVIDEYVDKVRRMTAENGAQAALALGIAGRAGSDMIWHSQNAAPGSLGAGDNGDLHEPRPAASTAAATPSATPGAQSSKRHPGTGTMNTGAILMGIGVVTFGASAAIVAAGGFPGVFGMTVGAILFAVGFVTLIVGALIYAFSGDPE